MGKIQQFQGSTMILFLKQNLIYEGHFMILLDERLMNGLQIMKLTLRYQIFKIVREKAYIFPHEFIRIFNIFHMCMCVL